MKLFHRALLGIAAALALTVGAQAQDRIQTGTLTCDVSGGIGLIIGSQKEMTCEFVPADPRFRREVYVGVITKFGLDVGATAGGQIVWAVWSPTNANFAGLTGDYAGASAEISLVAGLGANVLIGGSDRTVALQPLSISGQVGVNLAAGVTEIKLRPVR
ncbi:MAG: DUF992 domain-containing protein [Xanthobacteraceae bacterium]|nr:DUF992 domain-containing protein [Xanthobacteraceae bacterium]QYK45321.1 MAG: DUF992 domain-containing protein [Xanthobacteraceae bacterium]